jgi:hypothetical protein
MLPESFSPVVLDRELEGRRAKVLLAPEFAAPFSPGSLGRTICGLAAAAMRGTRLGPEEAHGGVTAKQFVPGRPDGFEGRVPNHRLSLAK